MSALSISDPVPMSTSEVPECDDNHPTREDAVFALGMACRGGTRFVGQNGFEVPEILPDLSGKFEVY